MQLLRRKKSTKLELVAISLPIKIRLARLGKHYLNDNHPVRIIFGEAEM
jgi:hypothetical protein